LLLEEGVRQSGPRYRKRPVLAAGQRHLIRQKNGRKTGQSQLRRTQPTATKTNNKNNRNSKTKSQANTRKNAKAPGLHVHSTNDSQRMFLLFQDMPRITIDCYVNRR